MKPISTLIVGCGDIGARTGKLLQPAGHVISAVCRNPQGLPPGFLGYPADYCQEMSLGFLERLAPDYVLATFKPAGFNAEGYQLGFPYAVRNLLAGLGSHRPQAIFMVSSTRVLAERDGGWVDESGLLTREGFAAGAIVEAEQLLASSDHVSCIVRFGGIYGDSAGRMIARVARGELCSAEPPRYSNRIHREDCAGFLQHLICLAASGKPLAPVYLGVDSEPAPQYEVEGWLARQLGVSGRSAVAPTDGGRSAGHKRCSSALLKQSGYQLRYPGYREGYRAVLAARANATS